MFDGRIITLTTYHIGSLSKITTIIYQKEDNYFFLTDVSDKLDNIERMPDYIKKDYVRYNSKELELSQIDRFIKDVEEKVNKRKSQSYYIAVEDENSDNLNRLKELKREFIIKKLL